MINNWTNYGDFFNIYKNNYTQLVILETLLMHGKKHINEIPYVIAKRIRDNNEMSDSITGHYIVDRIVYLERLGYVTVKNDLINLTNQGIEVLKNGTIQTSLIGSFFNHKSIMIATASLLISIIALMISIFK